MMAPLGALHPAADADGAAAAAPPSVALGEGYSVVKLRGLPFNVTRDDIVGFLAPVAVPSGGVHLMNHETGRPSGIAYVELATEDDQADALKKDKQMLGDRYIDTFACSQVELQARLAGGLERGLGGPLTPVMLAQQHAQLQAASCFVKLRGLPYSADQAAINAFFAPLRVVALQVALNSSGQPSGFGFVQFSSSEDTTAALGRSKERMGTRYVEVFRSTCGEMEAARAHAFVVVQQRQALQHGGMQGSGAYPGMAAGQGGPGGHQGGHRGPMGQGGPGGSRRPEHAYTAYQAGWRVSKGRSDGMAPRRPPPRRRRAHTPALPPPPQAALQTLASHPQPGAYGGGGGYPSSQPYGGSGYDPAAAGSAYAGSGADGGYASYAAAGYPAGYPASYPASDPAGAPPQGSYPPAAPGASYPGYAPGYGGYGYGDAYAYSGAYGYGA